MSPPLAPAWPLSRIDRGGDAVKVRPSAEALQALAARLGLDAVESFEADLSATPWLDGAEVAGRWRARVRQVCGVSLEPFATDLQGEVLRRFVPAGSQALAVEAARDLDLDPDADDPPDALEGEAIDVDALLAEELALGLDPFPRKPGVVFEAPSQAPEPSPFSVLADFKPKGGRS